MRKPKDTDNKTISSASSCCSKMWGTVQFEIHFYALPCYLQHILPKEIWGKEEEKT
jgi:hypothetical protein